MVAASFRRDAGTAPERNQPPAGAGEPKVSEMEPGMRVRHPDRPEWGVGQVQSVAGERVTVNFEHAGKLLLNLARARLEQVFE